MFPPKTPGTIKKMTTEDFKMIIQQYNTVQDPEPVSSPEVASPTVKLENPMLFGKKKLTKFNMGERIHNLLGDKDEKKEEFNKDKPQFVGPFGGGAPTVPPN